MVFTIAEGRRSYDSYNLHRIPWPFKPTYRKAILDRGDLGPGISCGAVVLNLTQGIGHFCKFFTTADHYIISPSPSYYLLFPNGEGYSK